MALVTELLGVPVHLDNLVGDVVPEPYLATLCFLRIFDYLRGALVEGLGRVCLARYRAHSAPFFAPIALRYLEYAPSGAK